MAQCPNAVVPFKTVIEPILSTIDDHELEILQSTYSTFLDANPAKNAMDILLVMFSNYPQYKQLWPKFKFIPDSSLMSAPELQHFAQIYMEGLKGIIMRLHDRQNIVETMEKIARAHMTKSVQRYHIEHMLPGFLEIMQREKKRPLTDETRNAWVKLFNVIAQIIQEYGRRTT